MTSVCLRHVPDDIPGTKAAALSGRGIFMKSVLVVAALAVAGLAFGPPRVFGGMTSTEGVAMPAGGLVDLIPLQAKVYHLPESRVVGQACVREGVTVWECTSGTWNGQCLQGLSLVLVNNPKTKSQGRCETQCYVSHGATPEQRAALLNAYLTSQAIAPGEATNWRVEPAVIRLEIAGQEVFVHLGLVA
jgi:hypothetical protein